MRVKRVYASMFNKTKKHKNSIRVPLRYIPGISEEYPRDTGIRHVPVTDAEVIFGVLMFHKPPQTHTHKERGSFFPNATQVMKIE